MNCDEIRELLYDYTKNEVSIREISEIETHLKNCGDCESELAHIKGISSIIRASMEEPPKKIHRNISLGIRQAARNALNRFKPALAAALVMVLAGTGFFLYNLPYKADIADVNKEMFASYAMIDDNYYTEETAEPEETTEIAEAAGEDDGTYGSDTQYYTGGYAPVNYIIGQ